MARQVGFANGSLLRPIERCDAGSRRFGAGGPAGPGVLERLWQRLLRRRPGKRAGPGAGYDDGRFRQSRARLPAYSLMRVGEQWIVKRPGHPLEVAFGDPHSAETFIREDCAGAPASLDLRIGEFSSTVWIDPKRPPLFRGSAARGR